MKFNINNFLLGGLLILIFFLFAGMFIGRIRGIHVEHSGVIENVILYILGIISGVVGDKAINGNGKPKE